MSAQELKSILEHVRSLSRAEQAELVQRIAGMLTMSEDKSNPVGLAYGKYASSGQMSTEEDFEDAEWRPSETELNGR
ncbi:MAG TPA: hypothetical protein VJX67_06230 [Blastocatellia bacterium]|nr:hypothetical protein [Blastocatellia bacterium]